MAGHSRYLFIGLSWTSSPPAPFCVVAREGIAPGAESSLQPSKTSKNTQYRQKPTKARRKNHNNILPLQQLFRVSRLASGETFRRPGTPKRGNDDNVHDVTTSVTSQRLAVDHRKRNAHNWPPVGTMRSVRSYHRGTLRVIYGEARSRLRKRRAEERDGGEDVGNVGNNKLPDN